MKLFAINVGLALTLLLAFASCGNDQSATVSTPTEPAKPKKAVPIPKFSADSAYQYVARQLEFGPRVMNTPGHDAAGEWMVQKLKDLGAEVVEQNFEATAYTQEVLKGTNIIARFEPEQEDRILLCAHWDTRHIADSKLNEGDKTQPVLGADDGASGVAVLLEVARQLGQSAPGIGVDIVLLDAEDYGDPGGENPTSWGIGAQYYSYNLPAGPKPRFGVLLDMVGAKDARFTVEEVSEYYAPEVRKKIWRLAKQMGYTKFFVEDKTRAVTDDHFFINRIAKIPTIDIINRPADTETGFVEHWHTDHDDLDAIDRKTLGVVGQLVLAAVYREAAGTL
jgi:hypothetical protein